MVELLIPNKTPKTLTLLSPHEITGDFETVAISDVGDQRLYHRRQTIGGILNGNERQRIDAPKWDRNRSLRHVARVPWIIWDLWESTGITRDEKELRKALMRHKDEYMIVEQEIRK
jgi:hypothetical protein